MDDLGINNHLTDLFSVSLWVRKVGAAMRETAPLTPRAKKLVVVWDLFR